jgi:transposase
VDRAKRGCKRHVIVDAQGTPLVVHTTPGNVRDDVPVPLLLAKLNDCGLERPIHSLHGDAAYGFDWTIRQVAQAGHEPVLAEREMPSWMHGSGLGVIRRVVEQTLANLGHFRRIKICYEKCGQHFQAFHDLAAAWLCWKRLQHYGGGL